MLWANAESRKLSWSVGDVEPALVRLRVQQMHIRDARRDHKEPPKQFEHLKALLAMVDTTALNAREDENGEPAMDPPTPAKNPRPAKLTLEEAHDILARHKAATSRTLHTISSDEGAVDEPRNIASLETISPEEVQVMMFGKVLGDDDTPDAGAGSAVVPPDVVGDVVAGAPALVLLGAGGVAPVGAPPLEETEPIAPDFGKVEPIEPSLDDDLEMLPPKTPERPLQVEIDADEAKADPELTDGFTVLQSLVVAPIPLTTTATSSIDVVVPPPEEAPPAHASQPTGFEHLCSADDSDVVLPQEVVQKQKQIKQEKAEAALANKKKKEEKEVGKAAAKAAKEVEKARKAAEKAANEAERKLLREVSRAETKAHNEKLKMLNEEMQRELDAVENQFASIAGASSGETAPTPARKRPTGPASADKTAKKHKADKDALIQLWMSNKHEF